MNGLNTATKELLMILVLDLVWAGVSYLLPSPLTIFGALFLVLGTLIAIALAVLDRRNIGGW